MPLAAIAIAAATAAAHAEGGARESLAPGWGALEVGGHGPVRTTGVSFAWDVPGSRAGFGGHWSVRVVAAATAWHTRDHRVDETIWAASVVPLLRVTPRGGRAGWFIEAGVGATAFSRHFRTAGKQQSTRLNFHDVLGIGWAFGNDGSHEVVLQVLHVSNASLRQPNPGHTLYQLKLARRL